MVSRFSVFFQIIIDKPEIMAYFYWACSIYSTSEGSYRSYTDEDPSHKQTQWIQWALRFLQLDSPHQGHNPIGFPLYQAFHFHEGHYCLLHGAHGGNRVWFLNDTERWDQFCKVAIATLSAVTYPWSYSIDWIQVQI